MSRSTRRTYYERNREKYRPVLENLSALLLDPQGYFIALKSFVGEEYERRSGSAVSGTLLLILSILMLVTVVGLSFFSAFLFLDEYLQRPALTAFILAWVAVLLFFMTVRLSMRRYRDVLGKHR